MTDELRIAKRPIWCYKLDEQNITIIGNWIVPAGCFIVLQELDVFYELTNTSEKVYCILHADGRILYTQMIDRTNVL